MRIFYPLSFRIIFLAVAFVFIGCSGGGSGGSSGGQIIIEGTLRQGGEASHARELLAMVLHSAGQALENIRVCIENECSVTDSTGQFGMGIDRVGVSKLSISVEGHGISDAFEVEVPATASEISFEFENHEDNTIHIHSMVVDGSDTHAVVTR